MPESINQVLTNASSQNAILNAPSSKGSRLDRRPSIALSYIKGGYSKYTACASRVARCPFLFCVSLFLAVMYTPPSSQDCCIMSVSSRNGEPTPRPRECGRRLGRRVEQAQDALVHAKHDGRAGHRPHQMRRQAAVQAHQTLLLPHQLEALHQARVFRATAV